jgi:hypothetical protein
VKKNVYLYGCGIHWQEKWTINTFTEQFSGFYHHFFSSSLFRQKHTKMVLEEKFVFHFLRYFAWANGKSKHKNSEIQTKIRVTQTRNGRNPNNKNTAFFWIFPDSFENPGNPNKKSVFCCLDFAGFEYFGSTIQTYCFLFGFHLDPILPFSFHRKVDFGLNKIYTKFFVFFVCFCSCVKELFFLCQSIYPYLYVSKEGKVLISSLKKQRSQPCAPNSPR